MTRHMHATFLLAAALAAALSGCGHQTVRSESPPGTTVSDPAPTPSRPAVAFAPASTVGAIVAENPEAAALFDLLDIDYCCGGEQPLAVVCQAQGLDVQRVLAVLHRLAPERSDAPARSWMKAPLTELIGHIESTYHDRLRRELPRLSHTVAKVVRVHGGNHPELDEVGRRFTALHTAILPHLELEEQQLFPAIRALPAGDAARARRLLEAMRSDHDEVGQALHRIRELTRDYATPPDACALYKQMLSGLAGLERDLHEHVHLENNVLLPRATKLLAGS